MRYKPATTFPDKIHYWFESIAQSLTDSLLKQNPRTLVDINSVEGNNTLVMREGTLLSVISIDGVTQAVSSDELSTILDELEQKFRAYMSDGAHRFSFYFQMDEDGTRDEIRRVYTDNAKITAKRLQLDLEDIIDEQEQVLVDRCHQERSYLLVWTQVDSLTREEKSSLKKLQKKLSEETHVMHDAQNFTSGAHTYVKKHLSLLNELKEDFRALNIATTLLDNHESLKGIRRSIDYVWTDDAWKPSLPGDNYPLRLSESYKPDLSGLGIPTLADQVMPRMIEIVSSNLAVIGDTVYAPLSVELAPENAKPFQELFNRLRNEKVPFRVKIDIGNDGMEIFGIKAALASVLAWTPGAPSNKYIIQTQQRLQYLRDLGEEIVKLQIMFCTWAPKGQAELAEVRRSKLAKALLSWGNTQAAEVEGDVAESLISSVPGASLYNAAEPAPAPLYEALKISPLTRPASPWSAGSQPYRTPDGKLIPFQPYSKLQTAWIKLLFGPMGTGKTVSLNYDDLCLILSPMCTEIPFISSIDIGGGARGLISLIRDASPKHRKHLAVYERLKNTPDYAINCFDTRLGLRFPLANHKDFLVNFLSFLGTADNEEKPHDGVSGLAGLLIQIAYEDLASRKTARIYDPHKSAIIDESLKKYDFSTERSRVLWWDVVDFLYLKGESHLAAKAQRYAVPQVSDIIRLCSSDKVKTSYSGVTLPGGEPLPDYMARKLTEAQNKYPLLSYETRFDVSEARIVSLDLEEVAKGTGEAGIRQKGLFLMLSYYVCTSRFYTGAEHLKEMPESVGIYEIDYRPYHKKVIDDLAKLPKRFRIDEKHNFKGLPVLEDQMDTAIVEGRKWLVEVTQASQLPYDFSKKSLELATSIAILGSGGESNIQTVQKTFNLSDTMVKLMRHQLRKPTADGANFISIQETDRGRFQHCITATNGPTFLWATNSTRDDAYVRDQVAMEIGIKNARQLMKAMFPSGNLDAEIEMRRKQMRIKASKEQYELESLSGSGEEDEGAPPEILQGIIDSALKFHDKHYAAKYELT